MIQIWIELLDPSSSLDCTLKGMDGFVVMCCAFCCLQRWVQSPLLNLRPLTSFRTVLSSSSTHGQSILPMLCFVVRLRVLTVMDAAGTWMVPMKHHRSSLFNTAGVL